MPFVPPPNIYTVSQLTTNIKNILENKFPIIWIEGEISNFRRPASGHFYFTLKDNAALINGVMFAGQNRRLKFTPEDGMKITGLGRISVYEPRGSYQIILEEMIPKGTGELIAAFEQLKRKLTTAGLFEQSHKKPLPWLPRKISLISSATGAVIHDMITVITRRFAGIELEIIPSAVQGEAAAGEIAAAIELANSRAEADIIIVARGGGSLEDLFAFNTEVVAQAVFQSVIPIVSAVGHETDFTICDFTADLRAPTPSAAAEIVVPVKNELEQETVRLQQRLEAAGTRILKHHQNRWDKLARRLTDPARKIADARLRTDDYTQRLSRLFQRHLQDIRAQLNWQKEKLYANLPLKIIGPEQIRQKIARESLNRLMVSHIKEQRQCLNGLTRRVSDLNPEAVLNRGYSITRRLPGQELVRSPEEVVPEDQLEIRVAQGVINCIVK